MTVDGARILLIDNYDSFTYNLVQAICGPHRGAEVCVFRNDAIGKDEAVALEPTASCYIPRSRATGGCREFPGK